MVHVNRLAGSTSPYLLQHASNPVDWYPWGDAAFAAARERDAPIFLSVGYAACHWCHVMERESFEDDVTAAILNRDFVAIKVDREERPDIDGIYMTAVQAMAGQGGWPMSVFLTPDGHPFWAATYLPDTPRHGMPSFRQVLEGIAEAWRERRDEVVAQSASVTAAIDRATSSPANPGPVPSPEAAVQHLREAFDERWGGFGGAPKFPQTPVLEWLLRRTVRGDALAEHMLVRTLDGMAGGGIHDQITRGLRPLQHRRGVARAALREDAVRQRTVADPVHTDVAAHSARIGSETSRWASPTRSSPISCCRMAASHRRSMRTATGWRGRSRPGIGRN